MNILMVAAEMSPLIKVGGLADVVGALPAALVRRGCRVRVVLPLYGDLDRAALGLRPHPASGRIPLRVGQQMLSLRYWQWPDAPEDVAVDLVQCPPLFDRPGVYLDADGQGFPDAVARASALCQAALLLPQVCDWPADVVHAHDVHAALAPVYRQRWYAGRELPGAGGTLLTIHNLAHQEIRPPEQLQQAGLPRELAAYPGPFEFYGNLNLLKAGILGSDLVNTVSPTYAREVVSDPAAGCGLEGVLASRGGDFSGILNGVDYRVWDPATDPLLAAPYTATDLAGKACCRDHLLAAAGLEPGPRPLLGLVGRLVAQKGLDLVIPLLDRLVAGGFSLVVLGTGAAGFHAALAQAQARHPQRITFWSEFSETRAHAIYAGCDLFLMPSRYEPCGLSQLYALRYGTPPVVRRTGGLADTVSDHAADTGTGFVFVDAHPEALWSALERARAVHAVPQAWRALQRRGMACDFSWDTAAAGYMELYRKLAALTATKGNGS
jgi:starch synthase